MIEFDGAILIPTEVTSFGPMFAVTALGGEAVLGGGVMLQTGFSGDAVLQEDLEGASDDWIVPMLSTAAFDAVAAGIVSRGDEAMLGLLSSETEEEEEIVVTGKRYHDTDYIEDGGGGGYTGGGGYGSGDGGGGASGATAVAQHEQDCGSEDGAAVQAAKHVTGQLPEGVSGPPNPLRTPSGND